MPSPVFLDGVAYVDFLEDELRQNAVLQKLIVIGEAASHLSAEFRAQHHQVEWRDVVAFRNFAVHEYFGIKWELVWVTATQEAPALRQHVAAALADLSRGE